MPLLQSVQVNLAAVVQADCRSCILDDRPDGYVVELHSVNVPQEERIRRLMVRDHCAAEAIEARMRNQMPDEEKAMRADYVILNYEGNPRARQVRRIVELLIG